jgi:hypothetical protein
VSVGTGVLVGAGVSVGTGVNVGVIVGVKVGTGVNVGSGVAVAAARSPPSAHPESNSAKEQLHRHPSTLPNANKPINNRTVRFLFTASPFQITSLARCEKSKPILNASGKPVKAGTEIVIHG